MGLFDNMLKSGESLFKNAVALDYDFHPKIIKYRENHQSHIASCIKPLFEGRNGKNLIIIGQPGVGKTVSIKNVLQELEEKSDDIKCIYVNCWKKDTTFKILVDICEQVGYSWVHNKRADELLQSVVSIINKKSAVIVLDEIDKATEYSILYSLLDEIYRKTIILITNEGDFSNKLDDRIKSRLTPDSLVFEPYTQEQTLGILKQRMEFAFVPGVFSGEAFHEVAKKTFEMQDIRSGLFLMKEATEIAEAGSMKLVTYEHARKAIEQIDKFKSKSVNKLDDKQQKLLDLIKDNSGKSISDIYRVYSENGGEKSYRTFHRKLQDLEKANMVKITEDNQGNDGRVKKVEFSTIKTLDEF